MKKHTQVYMNYFGYNKADFIPCECCGNEATSIHHLQFKSHQGGDHPRNLMALCFQCHDKAHNSNREFNDKLKAIHMRKFDAWRGSVGSIYDVT